MTSSADEFHVSGALRNPNVSLRYPTVVPDSLQRTVITFGMPASGRTVEPSPREMPCCESDQNRSDCRYGYALIPLCFSLHVSATTLGPFRSVRPIRSTESALANVNPASIAYSVSTAEPMATAGANHDGGFFTARILLNSPHTDAMTVAI